MCAEGRAEYKHLNLYFTETVNGKSVAEKQYSSHFKKETEES